MTSEELNRTIEFIIQSQARLAAAQEEDRIERTEFQKWSKNLSRRITELIQTKSELLDLQSRRLDQHEEEFRSWQRQSRADAEKRHQETLSWLQRIAEKITDRLN